MEYANIIQSTNIEEALAYNKYKKKLKGTISYASLFHNIINPQNIIENGPNLIIANHPGIREIGLLLKTYKRVLYFTLRKELKYFEELWGIVNSYLKKNFPLKSELTEKEKENISNTNYKVYNVILRKILNPLISYVVNYLPPKLRETGMPAFDISTKNADKRRDFNNKALDYIVDLVANNNAVLMLQFNQKGKTSKYHSYLNKFSPSAGVVAVRLYKERGLDVPISLVVIKGGEGVIPDPFNSTEAYFCETFTFEDFIKEANIKEEWLSDQNYKKYEIKLGMKFAEYSEIKESDVLIKYGVPTDINIKKAT